MRYIILLLLILNSNLILLSKFELDPLSIDMQQNSTLIAKNNILIHYSLYATNNLTFYHPINLFDGKSWQRIPSEYEDDLGNKESFKLSENRNNIAIDNDNNIWVVGNTKGFYKWNGLEYKKYSIKDTYSDKRQYESIAIDSSDNIWLTTRVILAHEPPYINYFSEVFKYDGTDFEIVIKDSGNLSLGFTKMYVSSDGRIFIFRSSIFQNIIEITHSGAIASLTLKTPHFIIDSTRNEQRFARLNKVFEYKNEFWFALGSNSPPDPGVVIWDGEDKWKALSEVNNYRRRYTLFDGFINSDSLFADAEGIAVDAEGKLWIGGRGFLNYLDENERLVVPDLSDFLNKSTFYSHTIIPDSGKEPNENHIRFNSSPDSVVAVIKEIFNRDYVTKHEFGKISGLEGYIDDIVSSSDGSLWISFSFLGVLRYQPLLSNVEDIELSQVINIYPHPVANTDKLINISFGKSQFVSKINIFNLNGKILQRNNYETQLLDKVEIRLEDDNFIAGTYFAAIELKDKTIFRKFLIK